MFFKGPHDFHLYEHVITSALYRIEYNYIIYAESQHDRCYRTSMVIE